MARKVRRSLPMHFAYNALAARRCYYVGSAICELLFYGNDYAGPKVGFTTNYLQVSSGSKKCCFRDLSAAGEQIFDRAQRAIEGAKLQMQDSPAASEEAFFAAICEAFAKSGFRQLPDVADIKTYAG